MTTNQLVAVAAGVIAIAAGAPTALAQPALYDYEVRPGDTCVKIARRKLGDRKGYKLIHIDDEDLLVHWGAGLAWATSDVVGVRVDARHVLGPDRRDTTAHLFEATLGIYRAF